MIESTLVICPEDQSTGTPLSELKTSYEIFDAHNEAYCMKGVLSRQPVGVDVQLEVLKVDTATGVIKNANCPQHYAWHFEGENLYYSKAGEQVYDIGVTTDYLRPGFTALVSDNPFVMIGPGDMTFLGHADAPVTYPVVHMNNYIGSEISRDVTWEQEQFNLFRSHDHFHVLTPGYVDYSAKMLAVGSYSRDIVRYVDLDFQVPSIDANSELIIRVTVSLNGSIKLRSEVQAPGVINAGMWKFALPLGTVVEAALNSISMTVFTGCVDISLAHISDGNGHSWSDLNPTHPERQTIIGPNDMGCYIPEGDPWAASVFDLIVGVIPAINRLGLGVCQMAVTASLYPITEYTLLKTLFPGETTNLHYPVAPRISDVVVPLLADFKARIQALEDSPSSGANPGLDSIYSRG